MERSNTVRASLAFFLLSIIASVMGFVPEGEEGSSILWNALAALYVAASIRLFILFWQTLIDAIRRSSVGWVIAHFFLGPFASIFYYLFVEALPYSPQSQAPYNRFARKEPPQLRRKSEQDHSASVVTRGG